MRRVVAATAVAMALTASSVGARTAAQPCQGTAASFTPKCSRTFLATKEPQQFKALGRDWRYVETRWAAESGREFLAFSRGDPCRDFGRYGNLRVKEWSCDGRLIITMRSVGDPQPVTFEWERLR